MAFAYIENQHFNSIDFINDFLLEKGEYEKCLFTNCDLSTLDFSDIRFSGCEFTDCNLSLVKLSRCGFKNVKFKGCKMLGLHFEDCEKFCFEVYFDNCLINHSCFYQMKLKKSIFRDSKLEEVDFTECDLTNAVFDNCDLTGTVFYNTILEKADFRTSCNYSLDPRRNKLKNAKFSLQGVSGLLHVFDIEIEI